MTLDPSKDPRQIDFAVTARDVKGKTYRGIYKFLDDELLLCFPVAARPPVPDPRGISGNAGNGQALYVLKKKKE